MKPQGEIQSIAWCSFCTEPSILHRRMHDIHGVVGRKSTSYVNYVMSCRQGGAQSIAVCRTFVTFVIDRTFCTLLLDRASTLAHIHSHTHNSTTVVKNSNNNLLYGQWLKNMINNREMSLGVANLGWCERY